MYKLTLKKAEGYIKSRRIIISLEYHAEQGWWVRFSWMDKDSRFFDTFYFANRYFNRLAIKHGLDIVFIEDQDDVGDLIKSATMECNHNFNFVIVADLFIEKRKKNGDFICSVACKECLPELKKIIKKFEKKRKGKKKR